MTKEEVLQRANEYCNERSYDESTLTSEFKDKFAEFFAKRNPEGDINDEAIIADLKFNLDTAKSASAKGRTELQQGFDSKENEYKEQIAELNKKIAKNDKTKTKQEKQDLPQELLDKLDRLEKFEKEAKKAEKFKEILTLAKNGVRTDLHKSLENYATDFAVSLEASSEEQAKKLIERFQAIFRDSIGDIKPLSPKTARKQNEDFAANLKQIKV